MKRGRYKPVDARNYPFACNFCDGEPVGISGAWGPGCEPCGFSQAVGRMPEGCLAVCLAHALVELQRGNAVYPLPPKKVDK